MCIYFQKLFKYIVKNLLINYIVKKFYEIFKYSMLIVGTIVGVGLASGQEIVVFFAQYGFISLVFLIPIFILFYFGIKTFLNFGKYKYNLDFIRKSKIFLIFNIISLIIFSIIGSSMIAGINNLLNQSLFGVNFPIWSVLIVTFSSLMVFLGIKSLSNFNFIIVPCILLGIIYICLKGFTISTLSPPAFSTDFNNLIMLFFSTISYVCCNLATSNKVLFDTGFKINKKYIKLTALVSSFILIILIFLIIISILANDRMIIYIDMPLVYLSFLISYPVGIMFSLIILFSIITTLISTQYSFVQVYNRIKNKENNRKTKILPIILSILIFYSISLLGFDKIIKYTYPLIGGLGLIMMYYQNLSFKSGFNSANNKVHSASKQTENNRASHN